MEYVNKIVKFDKFCKTCKFGEVNEDEDPCQECLCVAINEHSEKPIKYEEKK